MSIPNVNSTNHNNTDFVPPNTTFNHNPNQESDSQNMANDPLHVASFDHPGMMLTTTPFNRSNFLGWSRTIKMALGAKLKLGFIDGSSPKPTVIDNNYQRWIRCDYMVICWILNSMIAELSYSFLYAQYAFDLWEELEERYGQTYFKKLKRFWDELHSLNGIPLCSCGKIRDCTCGITKKFLEINSISKLMQFMMKLNDKFKSVRNQIFSMDPLPNINKAYYIVQQVEKQKQVTHHVNDPAAFFLNFNKNGQNSSSRRENRAANRGEKKVCGFCNQEGHLTEQCFEKIGYPDWYKGKKGKKFCQEMMKLIKGKGIDVNEASSSKPHTGILLSGKDTNTGLSFHASIKFLIDNGGLNIEIDWVVDTSASDHMCPHLHPFQCIRILKKPIKIKLPNGTCKWVTQDPSTRQALAAGEGFHNLYICKPSSPKTSYDSFPVLSSFVNKVV
ncbi:hypothetical protein Tco_0927828 [Tanacetum coccineum]